MNFAVVFGASLWSGYALPACHPDNGIPRRQPAEVPLIKRENLSRQSRPPRGGAGAGDQGGGVGGGWAWRGRGGGGWAPPPRRGKQTGVAGSLGVMGFMVGLGGGWTGVGGVFLFSGPELASPPSPTGGKGKGVVVF